MWGALIGFIVTSTVVALQLPQQVTAQDVLAFVTEVKGKAQIVRASGGLAVGAVGGRLFDGDTIDVSGGTATLIYLSGRSVEVADGTKHVVKGISGGSYKLMGRVMNTISEIAGPQNEADRPVVHGMARDLAGLHGAMPANTQISDSDFIFKWDALEGVEEYEVTLEDTTGNVISTQMVSGTSIKARNFPLQTGKKFVWYVQETGSFLPRSSGRSWFEIASKDDSKRVAESLTKIDKAASSDARATLKAITLYKDGLYYEAEQVLKKAQAKRGLSTLETKLLNLAYIKMERWDRLLSPPEKEKEKEGISTE